MSLQYLTDITVDGRFQPGQITVLNAMGDVTVDAAAGNTFDIEPWDNANLTIVNGADAQMIRVRVTQRGAGNHTLTVAGAGFPDTFDDLSAATRPADQTTLIAMIYNATLDRWDIVTVRPL